jgi:hypothetical protein
LRLNRVRSTLDSLSKDYVATEAEALALATRMASSTGLELVPVTGRERAHQGWLTRMRLRGRMSGVGIELELQFTDAPPAPQLSAVVDVGLTRKWVDMSIVGRAVPGAVLVAGPYSHDLVSEFSLRTDDDDYVVALLSPEIEKLLLSACYAGYRPELNHEGLHLSAGALDAPATEKLLRHATRLGSMLEARLAEIEKPFRDRELLSVLERVDEGMDGRLQREAMQLEIRRVEGTLVLGIVHAAYGEWSTAVELVFERPLPVKMSIAPVKAFYENWFNPDIATRDRAFDRAFTVRGEPTEGVIRLLGERSRRALEAVVRIARDVLVTQDGIQLQLSGVILGEHRLQEILESVFALAEALTTHTSGPQAYR